MRFARPAVVASLLAVGQAFLLPPDVSTADIEIVNSMPPVLASEVGMRIVDLACRNCPVAKSGPRGIEWVEGVESKLRLEFSIDHPDDIDILYLNGFQIYPSNEFSPERLSAAQISSLFPNSLNALDLGYELSLTPVPTSDDDHLDIIDIHLQIVELNDKFVDGLESVELKLLKATPSGSLMIASLETAPTTNPGGKDCKSLVCKLKSILANKFPHRKPTGCGSRRRPVKALPVSVEPQAPAGHGDEGHNPQHRLGGWVHGLKRFARHILAPVLIGVCFGFTVSLVGMLVGRAIVLAWRLFYRRGQRKCCSGISRGQAHCAGDMKDQKESLLEHVEPPPVYEDAPEEVKDLQ